MAKIKNIARGETRAQGQSIHEKKKTRVQKSHALSSPLKYMLFYILKLDIKNRSDIKRSFAFEESEMSSSSEAEEDDDAFIYDEEDEIMEVVLDEGEREDEDVVVLGKLNSSTTTVAEIGRSASIAILIS